jgi:hypothetical protein
MNRQYKIVRNLGNDSHSRDVRDNIWQMQSTQTFETVIGEILVARPEPLFRQTLVDIQLAKGGRINGAAYPGAFIDPMTGNLHGIYEGPIPGQMVSIGFANGNLDAPYVVNRYPYQGVGNTFTESQYINPLTNAGFHPTDVIVGHFSGSYMSLNTGILPSTELAGSIRLKAITDFNCESGANILLDAIVSSELKAATAKLTGTTLAEVSATTSKLKGTTLAEVSATTKSEIKAAEVKLSSTPGGVIDVQTLIQIKNATQSMKTLVDSLIDTIVGLVTTNCVVGNPVTLDAATIALLNAEKVKWALLLTA